LLRRRTSGAATPAPPTQAAGDSLLAKLRALASERGGQILIEPEDGEDLAFRELEVRNCVTQRAGGIFAFPAYDWTAYSAAMVVAQAAREAARKARGAPRHALERLADALARATPERWP
jgi:hypothetical protein